MEIKLWNPLTSNFYLLADDWMIRLHHMRHFHIQVIMSDTIYIGRPDAEVVGEEVFTIYRQWCDSVQN
jgi:hypothetical protein